MQTSRSTSEPPSPLPRLGRYELLVRIGKGGMASVYLARARGEAGFTRLYAIKVLHPSFSREKELVDMLLDEARIASRLHHPNAVSIVDVGNAAERTYLVMDYVQGPALDRLLRRSPGDRPPERIVPIVIDALRGLHAAHELRDEEGRPLELVHRDVTPGNVLVGTDGIGRITDFGIAKARARLTKTREGVVKGKAGYIAPELLLGKPVDRRADVFSMGVLLWNALTGETLFETEDLASTLRALLEREVPPPSAIGLMPPPIFDAPIMMALARNPDDRHESALEMAQALSDALLVHGRTVEPDEVGAWVAELFGEQLETRRRASMFPPAGERPESGSEEPPSTSGLIRKDPTGRVVRVLPGDPREERRPRRWLWLVLVALLVAALGAALAYASRALARSDQASPSVPRGSSTPRLVSTWDGARRRS